MEEVVGAGRRRGRHHHQTAEPEMGFEGQRRGGTRGGRADFDWEDVRADKHR